MKWLIPASLLLVVLVSGCASTVKTAVALKGASLSDDALVQAEWWVCSAATVGAVKRRYGQTWERADLYREFCDGSGSANVVAP